MHRSIVVKPPPGRPLTLSIPRPSPQSCALFNNVNRDSSLFLKEAGIEQNSAQHKALRTEQKTIQTLHRIYMHPFKYVEEQESEANQVIAKALTRLPWLAKYEDSWPARIYLKRYVDGRRPHLQRTRSAHWRQISAAKKLQPPSEQSTKSLRALDPPLNGNDYTLQAFLCSMTPSLEHHLDGFVRLGIRDQQTLRAFLSWPQVTQSQFLDENHGQLQLTSLEKKSLLVGSGLLAQRALERHEIG